MLPEDFDDFAWPDAAWNLVEDAWAIQEISSAIDGVIVVGGHDPARGDDGSPADPWDAGPLDDAAQEIGAAIDQAAEPSSVMPGYDEPEGTSIDPIEVPDSVDAGSQANDGVPPDPGDLLLDVLPYSRVTTDDAGRAIIDPDVASLSGYRHRDSAAHMIAWLNECGSTRGAIEQAVSDGEDRLDSLMVEYERLLENAEYDRNAPDVRECANTIDGLHKALEEARDALMALDE